MAMIEIARAREFTSAAELRAHAREVRRRLFGAGQTEPLLKQTEPAPKQTGPITSTPRPDFQHIPIELRRAVCGKAYLPQTLLGYHDPENVAKIIDSIYSHPIFALDISGTLGKRVDLAVGTKQCRVVIAVVSDAFNAPLTEPIAFPAEAAYPGGRRRSGWFNREPRNLAMALARELTGCSYQRIGRVFGGDLGPAFDHTTVRGAYGKYGGVVRDALEIIRNREAQSRGQEA